MGALTALELIYLCAVLVLSYAIRGSAGFGVVTIPLLALVLPMKIVVPLVTVLGVISSCSILARDARHVEWREILRLLPFTVAGTLIGLYFFNAVDARTLARGLGALVLAYGGHTLVQTMRPLPQWKLPLRLMLPLTGALAGFVGTLFGSMAGVFYAIYLDMQRLGKNAFRATIAALLLVLGSMRGAGYFALGAFDRETLLACAVALPLMFAGVMLGNHIHTNLNQTAFRRVVSIILIASGVPLLFK
ncbi:MAG: sulfite exporter TauE/SafE family protein [Betaproteobacteria bacterium]|nr:sulfite exporter TauE/SafE family protein [Betaproteobacteria bacterium]